uniref:Uncharacterized protein n=1 Tax=Setaria digitata TaxID=48799 RepID=A0A915PBU7_9BILA
MNSVEILPSDDYAKKKSFCDLEKNLRGGSSDEKVLLVQPENEVEKFLNAQILTPFGD